MQRDFGQIRTCETLEMFTKLWYNSKWRNLNMLVLEERFVKKSSWIVWILALMCVCVLSACNDSISPQTPSDTLSETTDDAKSENNTHIHYFGEWTTVEYATCTVNGEQERSCVCGEKETNIIDAIGHTEVTDAAVAATCTAGGKTEGKHCSVCNEVLVAQIATDKLGHTEVTDAAVAATCTADGKTEGKHCSVCNETLVAQTVVGKFGHEFGDWSITKYATSTEKGEKIHTCNICNIVECNDIDIISYDGSLGSAGKINDTTVVVSIFANDSGTFWDFNSRNDLETIELMHKHLSSAINWLENNCQSYGANAKFVYDWKDHSDLFYTFDFYQTNMVRTDGGGYYTQREYIQTHINSIDLRQKYNAQNIIYIFYFNTSEQNTINSWALSDRQNCDVEVINVFVRDNYSQGYYYMSASGFAHEILHLFGANDLYYSSNTIPQAYVDYCEQTKSKDIMYTTSIGEKITQIFSDLCAYYVGLIDICEIVEIWGLGESTHT
jgi:hypothetical protein